MAFVVVEGVESLIEIQQLFLTGTLQCSDSLGVLRENFCFCENGYGLLNPRPDSPELLTLFGGEHAVEPLLEEFEPLLFDD